MTNRITYKKISEHLIGVAQQFNSTRYCKYNISYHIIWIPKYRQSVLDGERGEHLTTILHDIADQKDGVDIISLDVQPDHVHLFVSVPPRYAPSKLVNIFKGASSRRLRNTYSDLKTGDSLWTRTYYVGTAGDVSSDTIQRYIEECQDM